MGHGMCLTYNKQAPLSGPNGRATSDDKAIGALAWKLLKSFDIPPHELRGLGVQIQKLEPNNATSAPEPGQARLPFQPKAISVQSVVQDEDTPEIAVQPASPPRADDPVSVGGQQEEGTVQPIRAPTTEPDLPSFSQVDMSVFQALPTQIRGELEAEYKRRSASPAVTVADAAVMAGGPTKPTASGGVATANLGRITRQLAPRAPGTTKPMISPTKNRFLSIHTTSRAGPSGVRVKSEELKQLGIDPEVFALLPIEIQREELANARALKNNRARPVKPIKPIKAPKFVPKIPRSPTTHPPRRPPPKAKFDDHPVLRLPKATPTAGDGDVKDRVWDGDEVQRLVSEWVREFEEYAPHDRDVKNLAKFLQRCIEIGGVVGMDTVTGVMTWWAIQLRRRWTGLEHVEVDEDEDLYGYPEELTTEEMNGRAWWAAYREVKDVLDRAARKRFGGSLSFI